MLFLAQWAGFQEVWEETERGLTRINALIGKVELWIGATLNDHRAAAKAAATGRVPISLSVKEKANYRVNPVRQQAVWI